MGRAKVAMELITNHKKRKLTFNTRKQGLIKKARELTTLCDVNLSMIIYSHDHENPEIFPPDCEKLNSLVDLYRSMDPEKINSYTALDYFMNRKIKIEDELAKTKKRNLESKYPLWFGFLNDFTEAQLREFAFGLEHKIAQVESRVEAVKNVGHVPTDYGYNNFAVDPVGDLIMQSWNNEELSAITGPVITQSLYPDLMLNMMLGGDDDNVVFDGGDLDHQPLLMEQFLVSDFASQVKNLGNQYLC